MARTLRKREELLAAAYVLDAEEGSESSAISAKVAMTPAARETPGLRSADPEDEFALQPRAERVLKGHVDLAKWPRVKGWVWDPAMPGTRIRLELAEGENRLLTVVASVSRPDIAMAGIGDGLYGFEIDLHDGLLAAGRRVLSLRCAETGIEIPGSPVILDVLVQPTAPNGAAAPDGATDEPTEWPAAREQPSPARAKVPRDLRHRAATADTSETAARERKPFRAFVDQVSATEISGWVTLHNEPARRCVVGLREGRRMLSRAVASLFRPDLRAAGIGDGRHAFVLPMPLSLLDGDEHLLEVIEQESGLPLTDEPIRWRLAAGVSGKALAGPTEKTTNALTARELRLTNDDFVGNVPISSSGEEDYPAKLANTADRRNPAILMDDLREQASVLVSHALRPIPENLQGYVEIVSADPSGLVWIGGLDPAGEFARVQCRDQRAWSGGVTSCGHVVVLPA